MTEGPRLIGRKEAAAYLGISPTCFSMWVASHKMPPAVPGTRKWDKRAIDAKLDEISGLQVNHNSGQTDLQRWRERRETNSEAANRPKHDLDKRAAETLVAMSYNTDLKTLDVLPGVGPATMAALVRKGLVVEETGSQFLITDAGHEEAVRIFAEMMRR
ncbi:helix-turn-helix transcriptional regulator [Shinella sumterensis]|uniref:Uncharacterized protein n=1 Tax=Shinella sumterensis TaxID=1967501 RepID=A0AA50H969_9HYPH|nr:hypothetical protein [Shinella sumterensis]WLR98659.1 hypothetical protein Q9313_06405 [Shinella sumterensis]